MPDIPKKATSHSFVTKQLLVVHLCLAGVLSLGLGLALLMVIGHALQEYKDKVAAVATSYSLPIASDVVLGGSVAIWEEKICAELASAKVPVTKCAIDRLGTTSEVKNRIFSRTLTLSQTVDVNGKVWGTIAVDIDLRSVLFEFLVMLGIALLLIVSSWSISMKRVKATIELAVEAPLSNMIEILENKPVSLDSKFTDIAAIQRQIAVLIRRIEESAKAEAIARMTQMLAHDVRKPFSILKMGLTMLGNAKDPAGVRAVLSRLVPEIDKAVGSVDGLIADVMEVGSTSTELIQEAVSPTVLIESALNEVFRVYPKSKVSIKYDLHHVHMVNVHVQKVGRVFSNIIGNALQAMGYNGEIWFTTRELSDSVEFTLGNAGSVIPSESLPKLFEAFFTSGKKGGTGLGLAIAEKVIKAHGGKIWCESGITPARPSGYVEFKFTLPIAAGTTLSDERTLPMNSSEITKAILEMAEGSVTPSSVDKAELDLEAEVIIASKRLGRSLRVLIIDDEDVYRRALSSSLARTADLTNVLVVRLATGGAQALELAHKTGYDLVITDVDMGPSSPSGFDLVQKIRALSGFSETECLICVHSNRIVAEDHRTAIESGADAFISKPAARAQLLKLLLQAAQKQLKEVHKATAAVVKPEVLVVDDNAFVLEAWGETLSPDATVHLVTSLEALLLRLERDPSLLERLTLVVTDMHFDGSKGDGLDVGRLIKKLRRDLPVLLSSDGSFSEGELAGAVDRAIGKDPVALRDLLEA